LSDTLTMLDLFCGSGGLSLGFQRAGFRVIAAYDNDEAAVETYRVNLGAHVTRCDLGQENGLPRARVVVGGPPCQGFSSAGLRRSGDVRNSLVARFAHLVTVLRPVAFVFENVEGFLTAEGGGRLFDLLTPVVEAGYQVHVRKVNAANYGVPQHRKRVIAIGGLGWSPSFPGPTHSAYGAPGARLAARHLPLAPSIRSALRGLPAPAPSPPGFPPDHYFRPLERLDLERATALKAGQRMRDLPADLWHQSYRRRAFRRVMDGTPSERRGGAPAGILRLAPDEPSKAITAAARSEFLHPEEDRYLTIRECARLQTFPDDFVLLGTAAERAELVGNAVPPLLAFAIARTLAADLAQERPRRRPGALLTFAPTLSAGMSPALRDVTERVSAAFQRERRAPVQRALWD